MEASWSWAVCHAGLLYVLLSWIQELQNWNSLSPLSVLFPIHLFISSFSPFGLGPFGRDYVVFLGLTTSPFYKEVAEETKKNPFSLSDLNKWNQTAAPYCNATAWFKVAPLQSESNRGLTFKRCLVRYKLCIGPSFLHNNKAIALHPVFCLLSTELPDIHVSLIWRQVWLLFFFFALATSYL